MPVAISAQLAQLQPGTTGVLTFFTAATHTEFKTVVISNTSGSARTYRIMHDDTNGATHDETTSLFWDIAIPADTTHSIDAAELGGICITKDGTIAVKASASSALTFTAYGLTRMQR